MLNVGGWEVLMIFLVALIVLGPTRLPEAARQIGRVIREARKISQGFQREFRDAMRDPVGDAVRAADQDVTARAEIPADLGESSDDAGQPRIDEDPMSDPGIASDR